MPFSPKNLNADETIALDLHPHWWYFAHSVIALIGSIAFGLVVMTKTDDGSNMRKFLGAAAILLLLATATWTVVRYLKWRTTDFVVTSNRLIYRHGMIGKHGIEIPLERVNNVNFSQSIFERALGAGDLLIESGGEDGQQRFSDIRNPSEVQSLIHNQIESHIQRRGNFAAPAIGDVSEQLQRLEGMLQRGTLSQAEFDSQKARLLG